MKEEYENFLKNNNIPNILYIYINKSEIENYINITIYSSIISIIIYNYLEKTNNINIYITKLIIIHFEIKIIEKNSE